MGLTYKSCKIKSLEDSFNIKQKENSYVVALAGNPNTMTFHKEDDTKALPSFRIIAIERRPLYPG